MNQKLISTIINRLQKEYSTLETQEDMVRFGIKYAGRYMLNEFVILMEGIPLLNENSKHLHKLFNDKEYQKQFILYQRELRNDPDWCEDLFNEIN